jgi:hypothetical protein
MLRVNFRIHIQDNNSVDYDLDILFFWLKVRCLLFVESTTTVPDIIIKL